MKVSLFPARLETDPLTERSLPATFSFLSLGTARFVENTCDRVTPQQSRQFICWHAGRVISFQHQLRDDNERDAEMFDWNDDLILRFLLYWWIWKGIERCAHRLRRRVFWVQSDRFHSKFTRFLCRAADHQCIALSNSGAGSFLIEYFDEQTSSMSFFCRKLSLCFVDQTYSISIQINNFLQQWKNKSFRRSLRSARRNLFADARRSLENKFGKVQRRASVVNCTKFLRLTTSDLSILRSLVISFAKPFQCSSGPAPSLLTWRHNSN